MARERNFPAGQGVFYEAGTLGNVCVFFLELAAVAIVRPRAERPLPVTSLLIGSTALASALVLSYSRSSLVSLAIGLTVLLWLHRDRIGLGRLVASAAIFSAAAAALLATTLPVLRCCVLVSHFKFCPILLRIARRGPVRTPSELAITRGFPVRAPAGTRCSASVTRPSPTRTSSGPRPLPITHISACLPRQAWWASGRC